MINEKSYTLMPQHMYISKIEIIMFKRCNSMVTMNNYVPLALILSTHHEKNISSSLKIYTINVECLL